MRGGDTGGRCPASRSRCRARRRGCAGRSSRSGRAGRARWATLRLGSLTARPGRRREGRARGRRAGGLVVQGVQGGTRGVQGGTRVRGEGVRRAGGLVVRLRAEWSVRLVDRRRRGRGIVEPRCARMALASPTRTCWRVRRDQGERGGGWGRAEVPLRILVVDRVHLRPARPFTECCSLGTGPARRESALCGIVDEPTCGWWWWGWGG